ncbi:MAG: ATP-dependent DNA ligase [Flavobacteriaceae bacterium]
MKQFAALVEALDRTTKTNTKVAALKRYFEQAPKTDALWTIALLSHRRPSRPVTTTQMRTWAAREAQIPDWLFEETYHIVGDLAETIALIYPSVEGEAQQYSLTEIILELIALKPKSDAEKEAFICRMWAQQSALERFAFNKIMTGGFRLGVSQKLMTRALSQALNLEEQTLAHRLMGDWSPTQTTFDALLLHPDPKDQLSKPYPFFLAYALEESFFSEEKVADWFIEHKWDGMRGQLIFRSGEWFCWSRGEELMTNKFPEFELLQEYLPDGTVLDGEILAYIDGQIADFSMLQKRIGRKNVSPKLLADIPLIFGVYDLLEHQGQDLRDKPLRERREILEQIFEQHHQKQLPWFLSKTIACKSWKEVEEEREKATQMKSEGLMLKRKNSRYGVGRKKGDWWKWKSDPYTIDAVLTYAMRGHGRRSNLFTDYTFALWKDAELVTFAKAYSGLTDAELKSIDQFVKKNTTARFGPVREVKAELVFEIAFEGISLSTRHKSGVAVRFPRILRWRKDKSIEEANTLTDLKALIV